MHDNDAHIPDASPKMKRSEICTDLLEWKEMGFLNNVITVISRGYSSMAPKLKEKTSSRQMNLSP